MRDFLIKITDLDDKVIGELEVPGMGADNDFVDIISYAYHNIRCCAYQNFPRRTGEEITFPFDYTMNEDDFRVSVKNHFLT